MASHTTHSIPLWLWRAWPAAPRAIATLTFLLSTLILASIGPEASAVPREDRSLGTRVTPAGNNEFRVTNGTARRDNLFHSFETFDIGPNERVFFEGGNFENIFSRVTGGDGSDIFGTLGVNGDANLFLMDPRGIVFGPDARLDLRGSFVATTADEIEFGRRGSFQANLDRNVPDAPLRVSPSAFVFNQVQGVPDIGDRRIVNQAVTDLDSPDLAGGLNVDPGRSLILLGGEVEFDGGYARATGGRVELGAVSSPGRIRLELDRNGNELSLNYPRDISFADITLTNGAVIDVTSGNRGDVVINGREVLITNGSSVCAGLGAPLSCVRTVGDDLNQPVGQNGQAGNIFIGASDTFRIDNGSRVLNNVQANATGNQRRDIREAVEEVIALSPQDRREPDEILFGSILIGAANIEIEGPALISTATLGQGNSGLVFFTSPGTVRLEGTPPTEDGLVSLVSSSVNAGATGDAGGVFVLANSFEMSDFAAISSSTFGEGNPGTVRITADSVSLTNDSVIFSNIEPGGVAGDVDIASRTGEEGAIFIQADSVFLGTGSQLQTIVRNVDGEGDAGNIVVFANSIFIDGFSPVSNLPSAIFTSVGRDARGDGGFIFLNANNIVISDSYRFDEEGRLIKGGVNAETEGFGRGGNILITAGNLELRNNGLVTTSTESRGQAGDVLVSTLGDVRLIQNSQIRSAAEEGSRGDGGQIFLIAERTFWALDNSGVVVSAFARGNEAGNISIAVGEFFILDDSSFIAAQTASGNGGDLILGGGNFIVLSDQSNISTSAGELLGGGDGGNITLRVGAAIIGTPFLDNNITAQAFAGDGGNIQIAGFVNLFDIAERSTDFLTSNDITASSEFGADGFVGINELDVDPVRGIVELPELITDLDQLLVQACPGPGQDTSELGAFYITGRGGVPTNPAGLNSPDETGVDWVELPPGAISEDAPEEAAGESGAMPEADPRVAGVEAQDWVRDANGDLWLVAQAGGAIAPPTTPTVCPP